MTTGSAGNRSWQAGARRIVYQHRTPTSELWEQYYSSEKWARELARSPATDFVVRTTRRFLPTNSVVLEGGCGIGQHVATLRRSGYRAIGLDFAIPTLRQTQRQAPELPLVAGDVFHLPLADQSVDGCWSLGVIEHFWNGYDGILSEMARVLRPGGYAFVTHPSVSPLRRLKARLGCYPEWPDTAGEPPDFYQFALDPRETIKAFGAVGFTLQRFAARGGLKGWKDEVPLGRPMLQRLMDSHNIACKALRFAIDGSFARLAGHSVLLVFRLGQETP